MTTPFAGVVALVGLVAAGIASVTGFGIGSLLTPILAIETGTKVAVASAAGGLVGALAHVWVSSRALAVVFGVVVTLAGVSELTGWMRRVQWGQTSAWVAGGVSGALGGMVGNQGGIRTAALLGFDVPKESFVATATAIGLFVDGARLPVYLATQWGDLLRIWPLVLTATVAVVLGTALGTRLLGRLQQQTFRRVIGVLLVVLGLWMTVAGRG